MLRRALICTAALICLNASAADDAPPTPTTLKGGKVITVDDAAALSKSKGALFVDTRSALNFAKGHVPGAVTAAYKEKSDRVEKFDASIDSFDFDKIPADKAAKIVFYSDGPTGWKSYKAAVLAVQKGYTQVMYLRGGFTDWTAKNLPVER
ncbi:rhodanese-like domain-containing protein [Roseateles sp. LYH14W]|uniref:Rhodanese-like domain-containing protein n=1 Tax=Pelomonas parva TaxID=3299032 RepID=A0ABW7FA16_9BURK